MAEGDREQGFARRWSRRKQAAREVARRDPAAKADEPPAPAASDGEELAPRAPALPPVEELTAESDYTPFLAREVPAELRRMALRKLWRSDPVLANLDGLNDYDEDFASLGAGKLVRTAYRIGKGLAAQADAGEEPGEGAADEPEVTGSPPDSNETET
jgi:hypothetical protein